MRFDAKRTQVAQSAFDFAHYFTSSFQNVVVTGTVPRRAELAAPEGMSTDGGQKARQALVLIPTAPGAGASIAIGWVEIAQKRAELRTFRVLLAMHNARFRGRPFDLDAGSYQAFFEQARQLLSACGVQVNVEDDARSVPSNRPPPLTAAPAPVSPGFFNYFAVGFVSFVLGAFAGGLAVYASLPRPPRGAPRR